MLDPSKPRAEIKALTSLRGLAAVAVVLQHFSATAQLNASDWIPSIVPHGYMAVDFFFVLSGFIMCYTYLAGFEERGLRAYRPFLWKRVARIFPLGIAVTAVILICGSLASTVHLTGLFYTVRVSGGLAAMIAINLLHVQGFLPEYSLNDPSWSVSVELGAYLLFPLLIYLVFKAPRWVTILGVALGIGLLLRLSSFDPAGGMAFRWPPFDFARCVIEFGFGMLIYRAYVTRSRLCLIGGDGWTWVIAGLTVAALAGRSDLAAVAVFPFLVLAFALNQGGPSRVLSHPWLHYLGLISFSIYLVHNMFRGPEMWLARYVHPAPLPPWMALGFAVVASASVLPVAALAYHGIERPGRDALNSIVRRFNRPVAVPSEARGTAD